MKSKGLIDLVETKFADIPYILIKPNLLEETFGTVFLYHGWGSSKENMSFYGSVLAHHGYQVVIPELIHHGQRGQLEYEKAETRHQWFWETIIQSVDEFKILLNGVVTTHNSDPQRIAIVGNSMGGFIASGIFAYHNYLKCLVITNSSCAWEDAEVLFRKLERRKPATEEELSVINRFDPIRKASSLFPRPILLLHGDDDTFIPVQSQELFYLPSKIITQACPKI